MGAKEGTWVGILVGGAVGVDVGVGVGSWCAAQETLRCIGQGTYPGFEKHKTRE